MFGASDAAVDEVRREETAAIRPQSVGYSTRDQVLATLLAQKFLIVDNRMALKGACSSDVERVAVAQAYNSAADQYQAALSKAHIVNDGEVLQNIDGMKAIQDQIQDAIDQAAAIGQILNDIASSLQMGSKIITLMV